MNNFWELLKNTYQFLRIHSCLKPCGLFTMISENEHLDIYSNQKTKLFTLVISLNFSLNLSIFSFHSVFSNTFCWTEKSTIMCLFPIDCDPITHSCSSCWTNWLSSSGFSFWGFVQPFNKPCCAPLNPPVFQQALQYEKCNSLGHQ